MVMNSVSMAGVGFVFIKASVSASMGVHCEAVAASRRVHSQPVLQPWVVVQWSHGLALAALAAPRREEVQREEHSLTHVW